MSKLYQRTNNYLGIHYLYLHQLVLCYLFRNYPEAFKNIAQIESYLSAASGQISIAIFYFYDSLVRLAVYSDTPQSEQQELLDRVQANQEKMQKWAHHAPMNHLHKFYLVEAERHRVLDEKIEAIEMYDKAIALAKENKYLNEEALANELAAKFYLQWGKEKLAQLYLIDAYYCYSRWGAKAKIDSLEQCYPQLLAPILQQNQGRLFEAATTSNDTLSSTKNQTISGSTSSTVIDLPTVIKAYQALSSEIKFEQLLTTLMQVVIENAGAEKGGR